MNHFIKSFYFRMTGYSKPSKAELIELQNAAHRLRIDSIESTTAAGSGHPS
jgi:transketolase